MLYEVMRINYSAETTNENLSTAQEYKTAGDANWTTGSDAPAGLSASSTYYFRGKATNKLASEASTLIVPSRPIISNGIDFVEKTTLHDIKTNQKWSTHSDMSNAAFGFSVPESVTPGQDIYIQQVATGNTYASEIFHLEVPEAPVIAFEHDMSAPVTTQTSTKVLVTFDGTVTGFTNHDIISSHADIGNYDNTFFNVFPWERDTIVIQIPANAVDQGNFESNIISYVYNATPYARINGLDDLTSEGFTLYPNPASGSINIKLDSEGNHTIQIYSSKGSLLETSVIEGSQASYNFV